ncbi:MAG: 3-deoxy-D-manno-octulosonic acid transferase [Candidatus Cloacimonetes bacterium]|nr:3-deoxy-D-manno-octulosonic acid transferase [Candidatus Cloacimonadota bacterium]
MIHFIIYLYTLLTGIGLLLALPFLLIFLPFRELKQRLGFVKSEHSGFIWFHCASVGEVNALKPLLIEFKKSHPTEKILLTTMTTNGLNTAKIISEIDIVNLIPLDFLPLINNFLRKLQPKMIILIETELWPSLLYLAKLRSIPVSIVNGRISDYSYKKYRLLSFLFRGINKSIAFVGTQSDLDRQRFTALGFRNVINTHNLKFCLQLPEYNPQEIRDQWHLKEEDFVLVWGSSRPGEEELLLSILPELKKNIPSLKIIIAPRHLKRLQQVTSILNKTSYALLSQITSDYDILLIDEMNILTKAYAIADLAIVGGSFCDFGGHNPLEPAYYSKPTIIGNFHSSCKHIVKTLMENSAILISSRDKLLNDILQLYDQKELRITLGKNARKTIDENADSVQENLHHLNSILNKP